MSTATDPSRQNLTPVFSTQDETEVLVVQELLRSAGIESMVNASIDHGLFPMNVGRLAKREILVLESDAEEAARIIAEQDNVSGESEQ